MRHRMIPGLIIAASVSACSPPPKAPTPQEKLHGLYRAGKGLQGAIGVGLSHLQHQSLLQTFAAELLIGNDVARTDAEKALVVEYQKAFIVLVDTNTLWQASIRTSGEDWMPKDSILAEGAGVADVVERNKLKTTKHTTKWGSSFDILPASAIQELLSTSASTLSKADVAYLKAETPK